MYVLHDNVIKYLLCIVNGLELLPYWTYKKKVVVCMREQFLRDDSFASLALTKLNLNSWGVGII